MKNPCIDCIVYPICKQRYYHVTLTISDHSTGITEIIVAKGKNLFHISLTCNILKSYISGIVDIPEEVLSIINIVDNFGKLRHIFEEI